MTWIQTYTGKAIDLRAPHYADIELRDIAHSLANQCRFTGHVIDFYSVAQHCVLVSQHVSEYLAPAALLHDSAEAYIGDVSAPLKSLLPYLRHLEQNIIDAIAAKFEIPYSYSRAPAIKVADLCALITERRDLMGEPPRDWAVPNVRPFSRRIEPMSPRAAEVEFLGRFQELFGWSI